MIRYIAILILWTAATELFAQTPPPRAKGLVFNDTRYRESVKLRDLDRRGGMRELPIRLTLRPFCPTPRDQGEEPSCVAWAVAYGALTIQQALWRGAVTPGEADRIACSKAFVYNQLTADDPEKIPSVEETFQFMKSRGTCLELTYGNFLTRSELPDELAVEEARRFRLAGFSEVYDPDPEIPLHRQLRRFKKILADSIPIVAGLRLPYHFASLSDKTFLLKASDPIDSSAHALCVIGYDDVDSTFECMNSWGTRWGADGGFVRIKYADFFKMACCAYKITPQFMTEKKPKRTDPAIVLRQTAGYDPDGNAKYEEIRVRYDSLSGVYLRRDGDWGAGSGFQLIIREVPAGWNVYVFNADSRGHISVFQRLNGGAVDPVAPSEQSRFEIDEPGDEWLFVLFSPAMLPDFRPGLTTYLNASPGSIPRRIGLYFKEILDADAQPVHNRMGFRLSGGAPDKARLCVLGFSAR